MMRKFIITVFLITTAFTLNAQDNNLATDKYAVNSDEARIVAYNFVNGNTARYDNGKHNKEEILVGELIPTNNQTSFFVFQLQPKGFVIVSANRRTEPILGYSLDNSFVTRSIPEHVQGWFNHYSNLIVAAVEQNIEPSDEIVHHWQSLTQEPLLTSIKGIPIGPLLTTQWDQWYPYNALCPGGTPTGCVATAMAQIMNYWQYPIRGIGYQDYSTPGYGVGHHQVAYNETFYQWDSMDVQHPEAISTLMYHAGTSCWTHYNIGGSGSSLVSALGGLQTYFDYSDSAYYIRRRETTYTDAEWEQLIIGNLNDSIPVLYAGGSSTAHAWVIDGYDGNNMFHMNFGWSGSSDGYYLLNIIYASWYNFSDDQDMVLSITPAYSPMSSDFQYAVDEYALVLQKEPHNPAALFYRAYAYTHLRRFDLSRNDLNDLLAIVPSHFEARLSLAVVLQELGRKQDALDNLNQLIQQHADSAVAYAARANLNAR